MNEIIAARPQFIVVFVSILFAYLLWKIQKLNAFIDSRKKFLLEASLKSDNDLERKLKVFRVIYGAGKEKGSYEEIKALFEKPIVNQEDGNLTKVLNDIKHYRYRHNYISGITFFSAIYFLCFAVSFKGVFIKLKPFFDSNYSIVIYLILIGLTYLERFLPTNFKFKSRLSAFSRKKQTQKSEDNND